LSDEPENEITLTAFRLLTLDLLTLFSVMNEGTINVLGEQPPPFGQFFSPVYVSLQSTISRCRGQTANGH
jgi:hypothetical protein